MLAVSISARSNESVEASDLAKGVLANKERGRQVSVAPACSSSRDRTSQLAAARDFLYVVDKSRVTTRPARLSSCGIADVGFCAVARPNSDEDLAFASIRHIGSLLRSRKISFGLSIATDTGGSISHPSISCGTVGLRPM